MKAWIDENGYINVCGESHAEAIAIRWNREHMVTADSDGVIVSEREVSIFSGDPGLKSLDICREVERVE